MIAGKGVDQEAVSDTDRETESEDLDHMKREGSNTKNIARRFAKLTDIMVKT